MKRLTKLSLLVLVLAAAPAAYGQGCALCTKTASELGSKSAKGLNSGILYLACLPLGIIGTVGFMWWRTRTR
jgi:hypothetical protein